MFTNLEESTVAIILVYCESNPIAPASTVAVLFIKLEPSISTVPSLIQAAPPYWALLLVKLELTILPETGILSWVTISAPPLLSLGLISPLPNAELLSNTELEIV